MKTAILTITCPDKKGLIAKITTFVFRNKGNIVSLGEFVDTKYEIFFMRLEWDMQGFAIHEKDLQAEIKSLGKRVGFRDSWELFFSDKKLRMAIFVSRYSHCLYDLLQRHAAGELDCEIPLIISNHPDLMRLAAYFGVNFKYVPKTKDNKLKQEKKELRLLKNYRIDFLVLARYMQILSGDFIEHYPNKIINIHHSFLPAFVGARAYHRAYERGVKIIGATSHFAVKDVDKGPIIQQGVLPVSHTDDVKELNIKGKDIEKKVLANAVKLFIEHRIFVNRNKTIIL